MIFPLPIRLRFAALLLLALVLLPAALAPAHASSRQKSVTLTQIVNPADPAIVWPAPAPIPFGTPLDTAQLNATAAVPGTFTYNPAPGAMPAAGSVPLSVSFQPSSPNFRTASASVILNVLPPGNSSFLLAIAGPTPRLTTVLVPGQSLEFHLLINPVGDFHQPVTLACPDLPAVIVCNFSASTVRPVAAPIPLTLTLTARSATAQQPTPRNPAHAPSQPLVAGLAFLGFLWLRHRPRSLLQRNALLALALALPLTAGIAGCGYSHVPVESRLLRVTATSLLETRTLDLSYFSAIAFPETSIDKPEGLKPGAPIDQPEAPIAPLNKPKPIH